MKKININIVIILFLIATNVGTIISVSKEKNVTTEDEMPVARQPREARMGFFFDRMGYDQDQQAVIERHNRLYNVEAGKIAGELAILRQKIVKEVSKENPDKEHLEEVIEEFGRMHAQLKRETVKFYYELATVSDSTQKERLEFLFNDMLNPDGMIYGRGRGRMLEDGRGNVEKIRGRRGQSAGRGRYQPIQ